MLRWLWALVTAVVLGACGSPARTSTAPGPSGSIVYGQFADAKLLNPILANDGSSQLVWENIFESLVKIDPRTGTPIPGLATSWDASPDNLEYTFHLQSGVTWSDGQPFSADDVLATSPNISTDVFNSSKPVGTGPYLFKGWQKDDHVTLVANPNYWRGPPHIQNWSLRVVKDAATVVAALKTGEVDYATFDPDYLDDLRQQANLGVVSSANRSYDYIAYNLDRPPFDDKRVRQALAAALDRTQFVQKVLYGQGQVIDSPILPSSWAFNAAVPKASFSLDTARQLLSAAGWTPAPDGR